MFKKKLRPQDWRTYIVVSGRGYYIRETPDEVFQKVREATRDNSHFILFNYGNGDGPVFVSVQIDSIKPRRGVEFSETYSRNLRITY